MKPSLHCFLDLARAEPVVVAKHGRPIVAMVMVESERPKVLDETVTASARTKRAKE